jgi:lysozyme
MWAAIEAGDFDTASVEMLDSRWARQVKSRATKLSDAMKTGEF